MGVLTMALACGWLDEPEPEISTPSGSWTNDPVVDTATPTETDPPTETATPETGGETGKPVETGDSGKQTGSCQPDIPGDSPDPGVTRIALIADFGEAGSTYCSSTDYEYRVSRLVAAFDVDMVVTAGDNNYDDGEAETIDQNIGQYYWQYIEPYLGDYPDGPPPEDTADTAPGHTGDTSAGTTDTAGGKKASAIEAKKENRFWPTLGNHDWYTDSVEPYTDYFDLPGNERYYVQVLAPGIELFAIDSDAHEPEGITPDSPQAQWLEAELAKSTATRWSCSGPSTSGGSTSCSRDTTTPTSA